MHAYEVNYLEIIQIQSTLASMVILGDTLYMVHVVIAILYVVK